MFWFKIQGANLHILFYISGFQPFLFPKALPLGWDMPGFQPFFSQGFAVRLGYAGLSALLFPRLCRWVGICRAFNPFFSQGFAIGLGYAGLSAFLFPKALPLGWDMPGFQPLTILN